MLKSRLRRKHPKKPELDPCFAIFNNTQSFRIEVDQIPIEVDRIPIEVDRITTESNRIYIFSTSITLRSAVFIEFNHLINSIDSIANWSSIGFDWPPLGKCFLIHVASFALFSSTRQRSDRCYTSTSKRGEKHTHHWCFRSVRWPCCHYCCHSDHC